MNQTTGVARHPRNTVLEAQAADTRQIGVLDLVCHDLQLALPWLAAVAPESLAAIRAYLLQHDTPALRWRLAQGEDAGLQSLLSQALGHLLHGQVRA